MKAQLIATTLLRSRVLSLDLPVNVVTSGEIESDWSTVYYSDDTPLLIGNDGGASTGGFHAWNLTGEGVLEPEFSLFTGRTKLVSTLYEIGGNDYLVSIPQTTSVMSLYSFPDLVKVEGAEYLALGDWSAMCSWKSRANNDYLFLFGKTEGIQFLIREGDESMEILRVR